MFDTNVLSNVLRLPREQVYVIFASYIVRVSKYGATLMCEHYQFLSIHRGRAWGVLATQYCNGRHTSLEKLPIDWLYQRGEISSLSHSRH